MKLLQSPLGSPPFPACLSALASLYLQTSTFPYSLRSLNKGQPVQRPRKLTFILPACWGLFNFLMGPFAVQLPCLQHLRPLSSPSTCQQLPAFKCVIRMTNIWVKLLLFNKVGDLVYCLKRCPLFQVNPPAAPPFSHHRRSERTDFTSESERKSCYRK